MSAIRNTIGANVSILFYLWLLLVATVGAFILPDYGLNWDEAAQREIGRVNFNRIFHNEALPDTEISHYGPAFELFLYSIEQIVRPQDPKTIHIVRHALTFITFLLGMYFFFRLSVKYFGSNIWALLSVMIFTLHPRLFAHAFFNSKDMVFLACFVICAYYAVALYEKRTYTTAWIAGLLAGILIDIRIGGLLIPVVLSSCFIISWIRSGFNRQALKILLTYLTATLVCMYIFWPLLWGDPAAHLVDTIHLMGHYNWQGINLFMGEYIEADNLPWFYIPVWIGITTPIALLITFVAGIVQIILKRPPYQLVAVAWLILPLGAAILLGSVLYDGWRHMYFIYPAICLVAVGGLKWIWDSLDSQSKGVLPGLLRRVLIPGWCFCLVVIPVYQILKLHPFEYVYFNFLAGNNPTQISKQYEKDYWGLSYKQGLEYLLLYDRTDTLNVYVRHWPGIYNMEMLPSKDRKRLNIVSRFEEADYFIDNFRWHIHDYPYQNKLHEIKAGNLPILLIYKLTNQDKAFHPDYY